MHRAAYAYSDKVHAVSYDSDHVLIIRVAGAAAAHCLDCVVHRSVAPWRGLPLTASPSGIVYTSKHTVIFASSALS